MKNAVLIPNLFKASFEGFLQSQGIEKGSGYKSLSGPEKTKVTIFDETAEKLLLKWFLENAYNIFETGKKVQQQHTREFENKVKQQAKDIAVERLQMEELSKNNFYKISELEHTIASLEIELASAKSEAARAAHSSEAFQSFLTDITDATRTWVGKRGKAIKSIIKKHTQK